MQKHFFTLNRIWLLSLFFLISFIVANGLQSYVSLKQLADNDIDASNTKIMLRAIKNTFSSIQDAELSLRSFLLSGDLIDLNAYYDSVKNIQSKLEILKSIESELPIQLERIEQLETQIDSHYKKISSLFIKDTNTTISEELVGQIILESHSSMTALRDIIDQLETTEYALVDKQFYLSQESNSRILVTVFLSNCIGIGLIIIIYLLVDRAIKRQKSEAEKLESMVEQKTIELKLSTQELERSNRELQDFAFVASHDLQEPLRKIRAFGDRLKKLYASQLGGDGADYINRMQSAASRMSKLIEDLLAFSRVSTQAKPFSKVDLNKTIDRVKETLELVIEEKEVSIKADKLPTIEADISQMEQLFQNLLGNAIKFVDPNIKPSISITLSSKVETDLPHTDEMAMTYVIEVSDNGIGFDEKYLDKIFTPFQRLHGKEEYAGTGIGLAICRRIVERHHGEITAKSSLNSGTTFRIEFPSIQPKYEYVNG